MLSIEQTRNCQVRNGPTLQVRAFFTLKKWCGFWANLAFLFIYFIGFFWPQVEKKAETWTSKRNSEGERTHVNWNQKQLTQTCWETKLPLLSHIPTHCLFCCCYLFISQELQEAHIPAVCWVWGSPITKERGKGGGGGGIERGCSAVGKVEQIMCYAVVNRRRLRVAAWPKGIQDVC